MTVRKQPPRAAKHHGQDDVNILVTPTNTPMVASHSGDIAEADEESAQQLAEAAYYVLEESNDFPAPDAASARTFIGIYPKRCQAHHNHNNQVLYCCNHIMITSIFQSYHSKNCGILRVPNLTTPINT